MSDITSIIVWDTDAGPTTVDLTEDQVTIVRDFQTIVAAELDRAMRRYMNALQATGMDRGAADELIYEALGAIVGNGIVDYLHRD